MTAQVIDKKEKLAGILVPVFALRHKTDLGIGDTQATIDAIDFCSRNSLSILQVLPINETGGDNSPYNAISSVALDPALLMIAPNVVPGLTQADFDRLAPQELRDELKQGAVDYGKVKHLKLSLLEAAFANFQKIPQDNVNSKSFAAFKGEQSQWLPSYCLFRTLIWLHNDDACWPNWPEEQRTPQAAVHWLAGSPDKAKLENKLEFFAFVQWVAFSQWHHVRSHADSQSVGLMGDIPFGVSRYSADVWANQHLFDLEWSGGAPPEPCFQGDVFTAKWGQNWGLPLYHWDKHKEEGFAWWRQRVKKVTEIFNYFRIDHVLGFFRIYAFPWLPENNGDYVDLTEEQAKKKTGGKLPHFIPRSDEEEEDAELNEADGRELLEMILDATSGAMVVAEDLGSMMPDYLRPLLQELQIPGFTIPYWERSEDYELKPIDTLPRCSLATYATHDHMPLRCYYEDLVERWHGKDGHNHWLEVGRIMRFLGLSAEQPPIVFTRELHKSFMSALLKTPCWLAIAMITDLLGTTERFNQPGTCGESNWSRRMDHELSWYEKNPPYSEAIADFSSMVRSTNRRPYGAPNRTGAGTIK